MKAVPILLLFAALLWTPGALAAEPDPIEVDSVGRKLDAERPQLDRVGRLRAMGILELSSSDWRFGGLSGLMVSEGGTRLTAGTDEGHWFTARLEYDARGHLIGLGEAAMAPLRDPKGTRLTSKLTQDAESLTQLPGGGVLVAFEHKHRLWGYGVNGKPAFGAAKPLPLPPGVKRLPRNDGIETMATLPDGALLVILSHAGGGRDFPAFLLRDGKWQKLAYRRTPNFEPTGATALPDGSLAVLERRFSLIGGIAIRVRRIAAEAIRPGAVMAGEELALFAPPLLVDNFEGIAARRGPGGETLIYLLSDDNFNAIQRNLLMMFALEAG